MDILDNGQEVDGAGWMAEAFTAAEMTRLMVQEATSAASAVVFKSDEEEEDENSMPPFFLQTRNMHRSSSSIMVMASTTTVPRFQFVAVQSNEQERLLLFKQCVARLNRDKSTWFKASMTMSGGGALPGQEPLEKKQRQRKPLSSQKFSRPRYSDTFIDWLREMERLIVAQCTPGRRFLLAGDQLSGPDAERSPPTPNDTTLINIPLDNRCMGCRCFYKTMDPSMRKDLAFKLCSCAKRGASYCVGCWAIKWCIDLPDVDKPTYSHELTQIKCNSYLCTTLWTISDFFILSVT